MTAFENADLAALQQALLDTVALEMPPTPTWFRGRETVVGFLGARVLTEPGRIRLVPTRANGQPAVAEYVRDEDGIHRPAAIQVLDIADGRIAHIAVFFDKTLFALFGLPDALEPDPAPRP
jgi:RNA polymerase sigma-70 factor (ECF subfamily)